MQNIDRHYDPKVVGHISHILKKITVVIAVDNSMSNQVASTKIHSEQHTSYQTY